MGSRARPNRATSSDTCSRAYTSARRSVRDAQRLRALVRMSTIRFVAYDEELAHRIRELVGDLHKHGGHSEQAMFGGLAFLIGGNMAIAASSRGGLMVRVDPAEGEKLIAGGSADPMVMRGREISGWLRVPAEAVRTKRQLARWVSLGTAYAASLPSKHPKRR